MLRLTSGLLFLFGAVNGDTYMQNPRGSNNRLNEKSANRNNGNRLFDSQNNNRGGYNVGETGEAGKAFAQTTGGFGEGSTTEMYDASDTTPNDASVQYNMAYQEGSIMRMTWTSQHGCGNAMNNCNMVIQFGCDNNDKSGENADAFNAFADKALGIRMTLRDGGNTGTPNEPGADVDNARSTFTGNNGDSRGRHESEEYYAMCRVRERNKGLFTADQKLKGHSQIYTRQNPNGQRRGLECPEERDYFPWDFPSPWRDIAWIGQDVDYCMSNIAPESMNVKGKGVCVGKQGNGAADTDSLNGVLEDDQAAANTEAECTAASGAWVEHSWGQTDTTAWRQQFCQAAEWQQINHLGNVDGSALGGQMASHEWTIPSFAELTAEDGYGCLPYTADDGTKYVRMVTRNRYNISTGDYDPYQTGADQNNDPKNGVISPVTQNPTVDVGAYMQGLRLALNTAQTGRTFQDRSHVFNVFQKPDQVPAQSQKATLNVNIRGKRGNIVQTFPAMEYDFEPNDFVIQKNQCMHFQWTGSNTHNNGNPAGDGQAGDAGEGAGGTDRSNLMEMKSMRGSYPVAYDVEGTSSFFDQVKCKYPMENVDDWLSAAQTKAIFATGGYYYADGAELKAMDNNEVNPLLNNVSASFRQGLMCCTDASSAAGEYFFLSTRNNNFTNRSQKMRITIAAATGAEFKYYQTQ